MLGLLWGLVILTLDRALVQSMSHQKGWLKNLFMVLPRIAIAVVLGVVISTPWSCKSSRRRSMRRSR